MGTRVLVWFKRDLRLHDHAPLVAAAEAQEALGLYIIEPQWLDSPEWDPRHGQWLLDSLARLREGAAARGLPLQVVVGDAVQVLSELRQRWAFDALYSHEETGPGWSYQRDLRVGRWCREQGVHWREWTQHGVVRRLRSRSGWAARWSERMNAPVLGRPPALPGARGMDLNDLPSLAAWGRPPSTAHLQPAGERAGLAQLQRFVEGGAEGYRRALSSPLTAEAGCSRLSPYLAWGSLSLRRVHQATEAAIANTPHRALAHGLRGFAGRLRWHCHFMQKLEDEPDIEFRPFSRRTEGLRSGDGRPLLASEQARLDAWCQGRTGFPMVDACMRSLVATGWLNFRMRALLMSFASYHLWLHWRPTGLHLARQFLDFEAGIHWSQVQMQSGTTGINTLRMYSPTKQALDQDPQGEFIRRWVPELEAVPLTHLHRPWTLPADLQRQVGCVLDRHYPMPVVDEAEAAAQAKAVMYGLRSTPEARAEADRIQQQHGSRKSGLPATGARGAAGRPRRRKAPAAMGDDAQASLFEGPDLSALADESS